MSWDREGDDVGYPPILDPDRLERRKEWEIRRARGARTDDQRPTDYTPIVFPECPGLCHAARVVAGRMAESEPDLLDSIMATDELLRMLGIIDVMNDGGDGRKVRVQRGPVKLDMDSEDVAPLGYDANDVGRPTVKKASPRGRK